MGLFSWSDKFRSQDKRIELSGLDEAELTEELHGGPLVTDNSVPRIFAKYSEAEIHELLQWSGIFTALKEKGYSKTEIELQYLSDQDQRIFVKEKNEILIHIRLKLSSFRFRLHPGAPQRKLLYIDWLMTRHPRVKSFKKEKLFPGQELPGLGIFTQITDFVTNLALGVGARGAFNIPEYFHDALLFHREFQFYDPVREAHFRALIRDLRRFGAREISRALGENRVKSGEGETLTWSPGEMISILDPELEEMIWTPEYFTRVVRELKRASYSMAQSK
ncbi:MAG: hypothetical protein K8S54_05500 [Spirochaetia bacterium]|nr:hypothetical protein [Spirochaetia bacterium]